MNVIWLSPHYDSPNADNGYDIRDYRKVMKEFGTMADFDRMLAGIKARHMRLIIDLVVNHSSDEHRWFVESRSSKKNPHRDYYFWHDGKPNPADPAHPLPPNNYPSFFSGSAGWRVVPPVVPYVDGQDDGVSPARAQDRAAAHGAPARNVRGGADP